MYTFHQTNYTITRLIAKVFLKRPSSINRSLKAVRNDGGVLFHTVIFFYLAFRNARRCNFANVLYGVLATCTLLRRRQCEKRLSYQLEAEKSTKRNSMLFHSVIHAKERTKIFANFKQTAKKCIRLKICPRDAEEWSVF